MCTQGHTFTWAESAGGWDGGRGVGGGQEEGLDPVLGTASWFPIPGAARGGDAPNNPPKSGLPPFTDREHVRLPYHTWDSTFGKHAAGHPSATGPSTRNFYLTPF